MCIHCIHICLLGKEINGETLLDLSREDIAILLPKDNQFSLEMKLYKFIQRCRNGKDSQSKSDADDSFSSCSQPSTSSACSGSRPKKRKIEFSLPRFTPDVQRCIDKDAFYTHQLRNKLIRQACRGFMPNTVNLYKQKTKENLRSCLFC